MRITSFRQITDRLQRPPGSPLEVAVGNLRLIGTWDWLNVQGGSSILVVDGRASHGVDVEDIIAVSVPLAPSDRG